MTCFELADLIHKNKVKRDSNLKIRYLGEGKCLMWFVDSQGLMDSDMEEQEIHIDWKGENASKNNKRLA